MRTTVDLPPAAHRRATELARQQGRSLSAVIADLTMRGLAQLDEPVVIGRSPISGFPTISIGRRVTMEEVDEMLDDE